SLVLFILFLSIATLSSLQPYAGLSNTTFIILKTSNQTISVAMCWMPKFNLLRSLSSLLNYFFSIVSDAQNQPSSSIP
ncbi:hypothetical protein NPIL_433601, partial [Nephila pilipes]